MTKVCKKARKNLLESKEMAVSYIVSLKSSYLKALTAFEGRGRKLNIRNFVSKSWHLLRLSQLPGQVISAHGK